MGGVFAGVDARLSQSLFYHSVDTGAANALISGREKEGVGVSPRDGPADGKILPQGTLTGLIEVEDANLVALAQDPQRLALDVAEIQSHQLGDPEPTVEKERQDAVIPLLIGALHRAQKLQALVQGQVLGQGFLQFGGIHIFDRIFTKLVGLIGEVVVERADACDLPGSGSGVQTVLRVAAVGVKNPVTAEIGHVAVDVREGHGSHESQIHIRDVDLVQCLAGKRPVAALLQVAEEVSEIQIIFVYSALGVSLDGLMVRQEIPEDRRRFGTVIRWHNRRSFLSGKRL